MKQILIIMAMITTFAQSSQAVGLQVSVIDSSILHFLDIQQNWLKHMNRGSITINQIKQTVTLNLSQVPNCDPDLVCPTVIYDNIKITLSLISTTEDACGAKHYLAKATEPTFDGIIETLYVTDNSMMICDIAVPYQTTVQYTTFNPWGMETEESFFGGNKLKNARKQIQE